MTLNSKLRHMSPNLAILVIPTKSRILWFPQNRFARGNLAPVIGMNRARHRWEISSRGLILAVIPEIVEHVRQCFEVHLPMLERHLHHLFGHLIEVSVDAFATALYIFADLRIGGPIRWRIAGQVRGIRINARLK